MFRRFIGVIALCAVLSQAIGCALPIYSGDPQRRSKQLLNSSENMRLLLDEWERIWLLDQPSHMTPFRNHGGIL